MQLVVMAAVLALAEAGALAGQGCSVHCRLTSVRLPVETCGGTESILTTICAGQCFNKDSVYISHDHWSEQNTCVGDWVYEVKHIEGCPEGVTYPVARNCKCTACNPNENTHCGRFIGDGSGCLSF